MANGIRRFWSALGPGLVTGAADDDPSGIATYSQAGAQFGFALTWTMFLTFGSMAAIQIASACIGWGPPQRGAAVCSVAGGAGVSHRPRRRLRVWGDCLLVALLAAANESAWAAGLQAM